MTERAHAVAPVAKASSAMRAFPAQPKAVPERALPFNQESRRKGGGFLDYSMRASQKPYAVRGKGSTSRMFWMPVRYMIIRSKPRP